MWHLFIHNTLGFVQGRYCLFQYNAVKSAESIGIKTFHYDKDKKDLVSLKNFLDKNL